MERSLESQLDLFASPALSDIRMQTMQKENALLSKRRNLKSMRFPCIECHLIMQTPEFSGSLYFDCAAVSKSSRVAAVPFHSKFSVHF